MMNSWRFPPNTREVQFDITSDEYKPYRQAILKACGEQIVPERTGKPGRPKAPYYEPSPDLRCTRPFIRRVGRGGW
jgi:hypothetical protein